MQLRRNFTGFEYDGAEIWRPLSPVLTRGELIPYEVSNWGRVRRWWHNEPRLLAQSQLGAATNAVKYLCVKLRFADLKRSVPIHRAVLFSHNDDAANRYQESGEILVVNHKDHCQVHNHLNNLELVTGAENITHARKGAANPRVFCRDFATIRDILRSEYAAPYETVARHDSYRNVKGPHIHAMAELSRKYGLSYAMVAAAVSGREDEFTALYEDATAGTIGGLKFEILNSLIYGELPGFGPIPHCRPKPTGQLLD